MPFKTTCVQHVVFFSNTAASEKLDYIPNTLLTSYLYLNEIPDLFLLPGTFEL